MRTKIAVPILVVVPITLLAFVSTPLVRRAGVPTDDGGANCTACHQQSATLPGSVTISVSNYVPGTTQLVHVAIADPQASRWGFELTARPVNDTTQEAGTFTPVDPTVVTVRCDNGTTTGSPAPCNGLREFAEHAGQLNTTPGAGFTFDINWTPPATEVGAITFYVAALAANGDGAVTGDRTYTATQTVTLSPSASCTNTKMPVIQGSIVDAAAFTPNLASGGLWTIKGLNFETSNLKRSAGPGDLVNNAFPTVLSCIGVEVNGQLVPITYVQTDQINFQGPATPGPATIVVVSNAGKQNALRSATANINIASVAPAFFTFNGTSIAAQFANSANIVANPSVVPGARPAHPGDIVTLYGTGFGATDPPIAVGGLATGVSKVTATPITVMIGNVNATVSYVGLSPGSISGLYQINVQIPATTPNGDIPVVVTIGSASSPAGATIPVSSQ